MCLPAYKGSAVEGEAQGQALTPACPAWGLCLLLRKSGDKSGLIFPIRMGKAVWGRQSSTLPEKSFCGETRGPLLSTQGPGHPSESPRST